MAKTTKDIIQGFFQQRGLGSDALSETLSDDNTLNTDALLRHLRGGTGKSAIWQEQYRKVIASHDGPIIRTEAV